METLLKKQHATGSQISKKNGSVENNPKLAVTKKLGSELTAVISHEDITKSRLKDFFAELTDLIYIDNLYRGIL